MTQFAAGSPRRNDATLSGAGRALAGIAAVTGLAVLLVAGCGSDPAAPTVTGSATPTLTLPAGCGSGAGAPEDPLACATISIPQWPDEVAATCPTGPVTLDNGYYLDAATNLILSVAPGVVTPVPGGTHVIAQVFCDGLEGSSGADSPTQVLAYAMDGTAFTFIEAIDVVSEDADITSIAPGPSAGTLVFVLTARTSTGFEQRQATYTWDGSHYELTDGPKVITSAVPTVVVS